jgi:hypothetical protein
MLPLRSEAMKRALQSIQESAQAVGRASSDPAAGNKASEALQTVVSPRSILLHGQQRDGQYAADYELTAGHSARPRLSHQGPPEKPRDGQQMRRFSSGYSGRLAQRRRYLKHHAPNRHT